MLLKVTDIKIAQKAHWQIDNVVVVQGALFQASVATAA